MAKWYQLPTSHRMTAGEYRANTNGINVVFGAVLGVILGGIENMPTWDYMVVLFFSVGTVVSILYLAFSPYRLFYSATTLLLIAMMPEVLEHVFARHPLPKLQPTLAAWALSVLAIELLPREKAARTDATQEQEPTQ
ncbi:hypothetical protein [Porphyrobacter sp. GA68]|uniref:hypothetical protein n=1 Tax=Porphyrobacter sp. GA68 TaxID=2883480 RepID=UPI001D1936EB|nr:hypothetical protein [Porphyrobacter sp. GA68]